MKLKIEDKEVFKPIDLNIKIETAQELCDLLHIINSSRKTVNTHLVKELTLGFEDSSSFKYNLYCLLIEEARKRNLTKNDH